MYKIIIIIIIRIMMIMIMIMKDNFWLLLKLTKIPMPRALVNYCLVQGYQGVEPNRAATGGLTHSVPAPAGPAGTGTI